MVNVWPRPQQLGAYDSFIYEDSKEEDREIAELKKKLTQLKIVARAKVTMNRVYCAQYHPEKSKDLIFFGGNFPVLTNPFLNQRHHSSPQINTDNWASGIPEHPQMKSKTTNRNWTLTCRKVASIGDYRRTGLPPLGRQSRAFASTPQTPIVQVTQI